MNRMAITLTLLVLIGSAQAETPPGWRWYNEPGPVPAPANPKPVPQPPPTAPPVMSATEQMAWFHRAYQAAVDDATLHPEDNAKQLTVMRLHHFIGQKIAQTGMTFKRVLLAHPELSYTQTHPVEQAARTTVLMARRAQQTATAKRLRADGWGLFFVYRGQDPLTQRLAPSIQAFADTYGFDLLGLSDDGTVMPTLRRNRGNNGKVSVAFEPALILVHPATGEMRPLAYGFISQRALLARLDNVAHGFRVPNF